MPINTDSLNKDLYNLFKTQGFEPKPLDSAGKSTPVPDAADVFKFTFKDKNGQAIDSSWATIENGNTLKVYYDDDVMNESEDGGNSDFTNFLIQLKNWAQNRQLGFELENEDHLASDMAKRDYMKKENILEGYYPMGKSASYSDSIPTVKIVLQHTRQIQEGEQRYRNVARIYLENTQGERILAPTVRPGIAQVYARHLAEGGVPNDERWNHIKSLCEEYSKMAGFVRAVRGNQFNESAQRLVEAGLNHYTGLRETLGKMRGHRGYNMYFESWTPTLMENEGDESTLNELFVQETLDPRIESVMPILSKLSKNIAEMKEVSELENWAESLIEAPGAETLAHNEKTAASNLKAFGLAEEELEETLDPKELARMKIQKPAFQRRDKVTTGDLRTAGMMQEPAPEDPAKGLNISGQEGMRALQQRLDMIDKAKKLGRDNPSDPAGNFTKGGKELGIFKEEEVEESALQAWLGREKYGKEGMEELQRLGREHASKEKVAKAKAKFAKEDVEEGQFAGNFKTGPEGQWRNKGPKAHQPAKVGDLVGASESFINTDVQAVVTEMDTPTGDPYEKGSNATPMTAKKAKKNFLGVLQRSVAKHNKAKQATDEKVKKHMKEGQDDLDFIRGVISNKLTEDQNKVKFLGYNGSSYPLQKAMADKAYRMGTLRSMKMDANGRPYAIINDPESMGDYKAYWNDAAGSWTVDFD